MKNNKSCNYADIAQTRKEMYKHKNNEKMEFMRKGESGGWKNIFTNDLTGKYILLYSLNEK